MTKYVTVAGDTFDIISYKVFENGAYTDRIIKANPQFRQIVTFPAGVTLNIPEAEPSVDNGLPPWKRGGAA